MQLDKVHASATTHLLQRRPLQRNTLAMRPYVVYNLGVKQSNPIANPSKPFRQTALKLARTSWLTQSTLLLGDNLIRMRFAEVLASLTGTHRSCCFAPCPIRFGSCTARPGAHLPAQPRNTAENLRREGLVDARCLLRNNLTHCTSISIVQSAFATEHSGETPTGALEAEGKATRSQ